MTFLLALALLVQSPAALKPHGYVNDFAHVLSAADAAALEQRAQALDNATKVQIALVTVDTTNGLGAFNYSLQLAQSWGVGSKVAANGKDKDTGLLILLAVHDRTYQVQIGYGLEPYITDADAGTWMRGFLPQLRAADYAAVFGGMLDNIQSTLAERMPGAAASLQALPAAPLHRSRSRGNQNPAGVIVAFIILFLVLGALGGRGRGGSGCFWPLLFMNLGGGGYRGGGWGGGFGGFGSGGGGGFGGFGGGGFGGGGAGGSW